MPKIKAQCKKCKKELSIYSSRLKAGRGRYCSKYCATSHIKSGLKFSKKHKEKISEGRKKFFKENPDKNLRGTRNPSWKGNDVGYHGVHRWIRNVLGVAKNCSCALKDKTCKGRLEWSNISGEYLRKLSDWRVLCKSHHKKYDDPLSLFGIKTRFKKKVTPCPPNITAK